MRNRFARSRVPEDEFAVRSLYMRLYRSLLDEDHSYPARFCEGVDPLLAEGHVERINGGYRLTEAGVRAWALMQGDELFKSSTMVLKGYDELRAIVKEERKEREMIDLNELSTVQRERLLEIGDGAGEPVKLPQQKTGSVTARLAQAGLIEGANAEGGYRLTEQGQQAYRTLSLHPDAYPDEPPKQAKSKRAIQPPPLPKQQAVESPEEAAPAGCEDDCGGCVHREIVAMLQEQHPEIRDMVALMEKRAEIERELKQAAGRLGLGGV